ncbi:MAG: NADH-quinone oxidoreductase subunit NuoE [Deltaproteobacteria bacterium]|nr:NADH-quinone oxidoreductase subunit NuoE [Deltaproteobacteria bacterium]
MKNNPVPEIEAILQDVTARLKDFRKEKCCLIPILQMIQHRHAHLPHETIKLVADHLGIAPCEVYGVATFYNQFRFHPPGKHPIKVCLGTACHVRGGSIILENFERKLRIKDGETTPDKEFSIERVACVGCCALAPVTVLDDQVHGHMAPSKVEGLILGFEIEKQKQEREKAKDDF